MYSIRLYSSALVFSIFLVVLFAGKSRAENASFDEAYSTANDYYDRGQKTEGGQMYATALKFAQTDRERVKAYGGLAQYNFDINNFALARDYCDRLLAITPSSTRANALRGRCIEQNRIATMQQPEPNKNSSETGKL